MLHHTVIDMSSRKVKVAAVHAAPIYMNKRATILKVINIVEEASKDGVDLLVFPETFVPGYPVSCQVL